MPTMTGTEHSSVVVPPLPTYSIVMGNEIITFGMYNYTTTSTLSTYNVFTRYDTTTGVRSAYEGCYPSPYGGYSAGRVTGAVATSSTEIYYTTQSYSSYSWGGAYLTRLDLTTNTAVLLSNTSGSTFMSAPLFYTGGYIVSRVNKYNISTTVFSSSSITSSRPALAAGRMFNAVAGTTTLYEVDLATNSNTATYTFPVAVDSAASLPYDVRFTPAVIGTKIYWPADNINVAYVAFDTATNTTSMQMWAAGFAGSYEWRAGPDGLLYSIGNDDLVVCDPSDGNWAVPVYPTTRAYRYGSGAVFVGSKIWVPSGDPLT